MNLVVLDIKTTGVDIHIDEVLQISIIDGNYKPLINEYCKPDRIKEWKESEAIHGITFEMVQDKPSFQQYVDRVQEIILSADMVITYNRKEFDLLLLQRYGISTGNIKCYDLYPEIILYYHRPFRLVELAKYYGVKSFKAHDSLEDTKTTLTCYYRFKKEKNSSFYFYKTPSKILDLLDQKVKEKAASITVDATVVDFNFYGKYAGVTFHYRNYNQNLLFDSSDRLIDSHCMCLDCMDGGNKLCKHVVAGLAVLVDQKPYTYLQEEHLKLLKEKKET